MEARLRAPSRRPCFFRLFALALVVERYQLAYFVVLAAFSVCLVVALGGEEVLGEERRCKRFQGLHERQRRL